MHYYRTQEQVASVGSCGSSWCVRGVCVGGCSCGTHTVPDAGVWGCGHHLRRGIGALHSLGSTAKQAQATPQSYTTRYAGVFWEGGGSPHSAVTVDYTTRSISHPLLQPRRRWRRKGGGSGASQGAALGSVSECGRRRSALVVLWWERVAQPLDGGHSRPVTRNTMKKQGFAQAPTDRPGPCPQRRAILVAWLLAPIVRWQRVANTATQPTAKHALTDTPPLPVTRDKA
jgi:hypothetical protein